MWVYRLDFAQNYKFEPVTLFHSFAAVMRFFYVRIRTECSQHVNSFIDAY